MNISGANPALWNKTEKSKTKSTTSKTVVETKQLNCSNEIIELQNIIDRIEKLRSANPHKYLHDSEISLNLALLSLKQIN
jgi:CRISPR/Cas system CMR subunit Cmr6 (Cas7 group RAMP superfamily)